MTVESDNSANSQLGAVGYSTRLPVDAGFYWVWQPEHAWPCCGKTLMVRLVMNKAGDGLDVEVPTHERPVRLVEGISGASTSAAWWGAHWQGPVEPPAIGMVRGAVTGGEFSGSAAVKAADVLPLALRVQPGVNELIREAAAAASPVSPQKPGAAAAAHPIGGEMPESWFVGMSESYRQEAWRIALQIQHGVVAWPGGVASAHVEIRECDHCGHMGVNDSNDQKSACTQCDWHGAEPEEDVCPSCATTGSMTASCPRCGHRYRLIEEKQVPCSAPPERVDERALFGNSVDKAKRIMRLVDAYVDKPSSSTRGDLRGALMEELQAVSQYRLIRTSPEFSFAAMCRGEIALPALDLMLDLYRSHPGGRVNQAGGVRGEGDGALTEDLSATGSGGSSSRHGGARNFSGVDFVQNICGNDSLDSSEGRRASAHIADGLDVASGGRGGQ